MEEIEKFGGYPTTDNFNSLEWMKTEKKMPIPQSAENPYVEAFGNGGQNCIEIYTLLELQVVNL